MKYVIISIAALVLCFLLALLIVKVVHKKAKRKTGKFKTTLLSIAVCLALYCLVALAYMSVYYHADKDAVNKAFATPGITVSKFPEGKAKGYSFKKDGNDKAMIFYAGAKVDELAYSPLMAKLADGGIDCYLIKIPFHMAMFAADAPSRVLENINDMHYGLLMVGGHSLGGIVASQYAAAHSDVIDAIVLLASYSTVELPQNIALCSIYGSNDGCLELDQYETQKGNFPAISEEHILDGANHAQFASYGPQKGDGIATISPDSQVDETAEIICNFVNKIGYR